MKKFVLLFALLLIQAVGLRAQNIAGIVKPEAGTLKKIKAGKAYLVDVRTPEEFNSGHLEYATNINYNSPDFKAQIARLDKKKPVYLYCRSGNRSGKASDTLKTLGFTTFYNIGGFENLKADGFPAADDPTVATRTNSVK